MTFNVQRSTFKVQLGLILFVLWLVWPRMLSAAWVNRGAVELSKAMVEDTVQHTERAAMYLNRAAEAGSGRAYRNLAWIRLARGEAEPAAELLARAGTLGVEDESAYWALGQLYWKQSRVMEAAEPLKRVVRGDPDRLYKMLWNLMGAEGPKHRVWEVMIELGHDAIARDPTHVFPYILLGMMYGHVDYEVSNQWFEEALRRWPGDVMVLTGLAGNAIWQKDYPRARTYLNEALGQNDTEARPYFLMGQTYDEEGQIEPAVHWYREALARDPRSEYHRALAALYDRSGQYDLALAEYQVILEQQPDDAQVRAQIERLQGLINDSNDQK